MLESDAPEAPKRASYLEPVHAILEAGWIVLVLIALAIDFAILCAANVKAKLRSFRA